MWTIPVLASLAALIVLLLCVPLDVVLRVDMDGRPKFRARLACLFGLVTKDLRREKEKPEGVSCPRCGKLNRPEIAYCAYCWDYLGDFHQPKLKQGGGLLHHPGHRALRGS